MKSVYTPHDIFASPYVVEIVDMLLNFLVVNTQDINSYDELTEKEKKVVNEKAFNLILKPNTLEEKIEKLFKEFKAEKFGLISSSEKAFIEKSLGLSDKLSVKELANIRNKIVEYAYELLKGSEVTLTKESQLAIMDKMSAFVCVIDRLKILKGAEV